MTMQADILSRMMAVDRRKYRGLKPVVSHHVLQNPKRIRQKHKELVYILGIRVDAKTDFVLDYYSDNESLEIAQSIATPQVHECNVVSRHLGDVCFNMSNNDDYYVNIIKVKFI
jgi:hypothetical protein